MEVRNILMAFTARKEEEEMVPLVCRFARALRAKLFVVYVVEVPLTLPVDAPNAPGLDKAEGVLTRAEEIARRERVEVNTDIVQAREAGVAIVEEAQKIKADLIMLSARWDPKHPELPIGETIRYLFRHAPCPVWVSCLPSGLK